MISMGNSPMLFDRGSLWSWMQVKIWQVALGSWQLIQKNSVHQHKTPVRNAKTLYWSYTKNWTTQQLKKHVLLSHCAHRLHTSICHQNYSIVRKQGKEKKKVNHTPFILLMPNCISQFLSCRHTPLSPYKHGCFPALNGNYYHWLLCVLGKSAIDKTFFSNVVFKPHMPPQLQIGVTVTS